MADSETHIWDRLELAWPIMGGGLPRTFTLHGERHEPGDDELRAWGAALERNILQHNIPHQFGTISFPPDAQWPILSRLTHRIVLDIPDGLEWGAPREWAVLPVTLTGDELAQQAVQN